MAKTRQQKEVEFRDLQQKLADSKATVFINFSGIGVHEINKLRSQAKEENAEYYVAKKTLLKKVLAEKGYDQADFNGEVAVLFGYNDEIVPAKLAADFAKNNENFEILNGILEGNIIDMVKIKALASLPSREELMAKAVGSIAAPLSGFVNVLQSNLRGLVYALNAIKDKKA